MNILEVKNTYNDRVIRMGMTPQSLGWRSWEQQKLRFEIIHSQMDVDKSDRIYDLGCGFADFLDYLKLNCPEFQDEHYFGIDISEQMIEQSKRKYPNSKFLVGNFLAEISSQEVDWVVCSGALNFLLDRRDLYGVLESFIQIHIKNATKGIVFNLITDRVDYRDALLAYYNPENVLNLLSKYSKFYSIRADYPLYEFTCSIKRGC